MTWRERRARSLHHAAPNHTIVCVNADRLSITLEPALGAAARKAAKRAKVSLSAWIAEATAERLRTEALRDALDQWQSEDGAFTVEELAEAGRSLRVSGNVERPKATRKPRR